MQDFTIIAGHPKSGINACTWLLKQCGYTVGLREDADDLSVFGLYNPKTLKDQFLESTYAPFINHKNNIDTVTPEMIEEDFLKELISKINLIKHTNHQFVNSNSSFLYVVPLIWDHIKDHAKLIITNRSKESIIPLLKTNENFEEEYIELSNQISILKLLFENSERPIFELDFKNLDREGIENELSNFANVQIQGDITNLSWLDTIIESFDK